MMQNTNFPNQGTCFHFSDISGIKIPGKFNIENKICCSLFSMTDHINDVSIVYKPRQNCSYVKDFLGDVSAHTIALSM